MGVPFFMQQVEDGYLLDRHICNAMAHGPCSSSDYGSEVVRGLPWFWFSHCDVNMVLVSFEVVWDFW